MFAKNTCASLFLLLMLVQMMYREQPRQQSSKEELLARLKNLKGDEYEGLRKQVSDTRTDDLIHIAGDKSSDWIPRLYSVHLLYDLHSSERRAIIDGMLRIVADVNTHEALRVAAAKFLGELRAIEATDTLIAHSLEFKHASHSNFHYAGLYPCVSALIEIGRPASEAVLQEMKRPLDERHREAFAEILLSVEGRNVGRFMLEQEIADAKRPEERENLLKSLEYFSP